MRPYADTLLTGLVYLAAVFVLLLVAKAIYELLHPRFVLRRELFERDNLALALVMVGYYLGLVIALGGVLVGPSNGLQYDLIDLGLYGILAIVLLNASGWINDKLVLRHFSNEKEILVDRNAGTGMIELGSHVANGLILAGALSGQGGGLVTAVVFWAAGQAVLIAAAWVYDAVTSFDLHAEIERDNVAVGVAFAGVLVGIGNVVRLGIEGDFDSWTGNFVELGLYAGAGLILLPLVRWATDLVLVPGVTLSAELLQSDRPNVGAGAIEGFSYVAASMLIAWTL